MEPSTRGAQHVSSSALEQVERALDRYRDVVARSGLEEKTQATYIRHAETFVRWLKGDFEPGSRKQRL